MDFESRVRSVVREMFVSYVTDGGVLYDKTEKPRKIIVPSRPTGDLDDLIREICCFRGKTLGKETPERKPQDKWVEITKPATYATPDGLAGITFPGFAECVKVYNSTATVGDNPYYYMAGNVAQYNNFMTAWKARSDANRTYLNWLTDVTGAGFVVGRDPIRMTELYKTIAQGGTTYDTQYPVLLQYWRKDYTFEVRRVYVNFRTGQTKTVVTQAKSESWDWNRFAFNGGVRRANAVNCCSPGTNVNPGAMTGGDKTGDVQIQMGYLILAQFIFVVDIKVAPIHHHTWKDTTPEEPAPMSGTTDPDVTTPPGVQLGPEERQAGYYSDVYVVQYNGSEYQLDVNGNLTSFGGGYNTDWAAASAGIARAGIQFTSVRTETLMVNGTPMTANIYTYFAPTTYPSFNSTYVNGETLSISDRRYAWQN